MKTSQKIGGFSALILIAIYLIGIVMNVTMLDTSGIHDPVELVRFMQANEALMLVWISLLYVVFGIVLVFITLALHEKTKHLNSFNASVAAAFGLIWSCLVIASGMVHNIGMTAAIDMLSTSPEKAGEFYSIISNIHIGLGGGNEIPGALWTMTVSLLCLKHGIFKKWINIVGIIVGVAGLLTIAPPLFNYTVMVFALGQMLWWLGIGLDMIKSN